jgi:hypothetical protein
MKIWAWRSIILRRPREDEGSGVLDVLGDDRTRVLFSFIAQYRKSTL